MQHFIKALTVMGIISTWSVHALADGKVTAAEGYDLLVQLGAALGLPLEFTLPDMEGPNHG